MSEIKNAAIIRARNELAEEQMEKDVTRLKSVYRDLARAEQVVKNLGVEVADLEEAIRSGN